jgi:hypothetical protein
LDDERPNYRSSRPGATRTQETAAANDLAPELVPVDEIPSDLRSSCPDALFVSSGALVEAADLAVGVANLDASPSRTVQIRLPGPVSARSTRRRLSRAIVTSRLSISLAD